LARADEVEKAARWTALSEGEDVADDSRERYERERHREQKDCDIFCGRFVFLGQSMNTGALSGYMYMRYVRLHLQFPGVFSFARHVQIGLLAPP
jgi:hypothetical protein